MIAYLLKVTLIWCILLLVYECLYRKSTAFSYNRIYLFLSLFAGIALPFIHLDLPWATVSQSAAVPVTDGVRNMEAWVTTAAEPGVQGNAAVTVPDVAGWIYLAGVILTAVLSLRDIALIIRKAIYGKHITVDGHRIFTGGRNHAPFSFMGWIFIARPEQYSPAELSYLLLHENAHNSRLHWLDMMLMQLVFVLFWFHPLVWRFRYLLKLTHEFEADKIAANIETYAYGQFLLQQTLFRGIPAIAHSFHFSPIKNRITMLITTKKTSKWKFAIILPVLLGCTVLFAKTTSGLQRVRTGDVTTFKGHIFIWNTPKPDSLAQSLIDKGFLQQPQYAPPRIVKYDRDSVLSENMVSLKPQFRSANRSFTEYMTEQFKQKVHKRLDSISQIAFTNIVLDANGKIMYYDLVYMGRRVLRKDENGMANNPEMDKIIDDLIEKSPNWAPGAIDGKPRPSFVEWGGAIVLNNLSFMAVPIK